MATMDEILLTFLQLVNGDKNATNEVSGKIVTGLRCGTCMHICPFRYTNNPSNMIRKIKPTGAENRELSSTVAGNARVPLANAILKSDWLTIIFCF